MKKNHKSFKSRHSSKSALKKMFKGRVETDDSRKTGKPTVKVVSKLQRKNFAKQVRDQKIKASSENRKLFDGANGAAKIVTVIPLTTDVYADDIVKKLLAGEFPANDLLQSNIVVPSTNNIFISKFKSNLKIIIPDMNDMINLLDSCKIADFVVFGLSGTSEVDPEIGEQVIRALELQGISSYIGVVSNLSQVHPKEKFQLDVKQSLESYFKHFFPNEEKIYNLEKSSESLNCLRTLCQKLPRNVNWRDSRGYLVADSVSYEQDDTTVENDGTNGCLVVEGTARGIGFNVNRLVHLPGLGDFQITKMMKLVKNGDDSCMVPSADQQDSLEEYANHDMEMEADSDMEDFDDEGHDYQYDNLTSARYDEHGFLPGKAEPLRKPKVPKGTSDYQSKWYLDDMVEEGEEVEDEDEDEDEELIGENDDQLELGDELPDFQENRDSLYQPTEAGETEMFVELSPEEEERQLLEYRNMEKEDREFPDELELSPNESGIERLKRYRGLKNLHNCVWEVDEKDPTCPSEWNRVLRISNYKNVKRQVLNNAQKQAQVKAGDKIKMYIKFPQEMLDKVVDPKQLVFTVFGLLPHEHQQTVANFSIQRWEDYENPVPAEEPIIVQYGIRRQVIQPCFSSASVSPNNVHKFERFLHEDSVSVATCIALADFTQSPAIFFRKNSEKPTGIEFIGHGSFLSSDHTRILAKRVVLTGHPFKFHKNVVTVRYMFFNADDIEWFKSIPLFTKSGRSGFIKESLGTHGYFKATFDTKLSAQDVVAMALFKRIWPKTSVGWDQ